MATLATWNLQVADRIVGDRVRIPSIGREVRRSKVLVRLVRERAFGEGSAVAKKRTAVLSVARSAGIAASAKKPARVSAVLSIKLRIYERSSNSAIGMPRALNKAKTGFHKRVTQ